jgi:hypothetical protein
MGQRRSHFAGPSLAEVVFESSDGWWVVSVPNVAGAAGAYSQGKTRESAYSGAAWAFTHAFNIQVQPVGLSKTDAGAHP